LNSSVYATLDYLLYRPTTSMAEDAPAAKRLARAGSFSGVWWKLGDAAVDPSVAERRLRSIADEEADLRTRIAARQAGARGVRRRIAFASIAVEVLLLTLRQVSPS
jgi:hypothetical protein